MKHKTPFLNLRLSILLASSALAVASCHPDNPAPEPQQSKIETPRHIAAADGHLYVSCYRPASVVRIDTASLRVDASCPLGNYNPEGVAVAGGKLFAVSSWNQTENGDYLYDDKVYVIDLATFTVSTTLTVGTNPQQVKVLDDNRLIVNYNGNYADQPAGSAIIDATTLDVLQTGLPMTSMSIHNGKVYCYSTSYDAQWNPTATYLCYDPSTASSSPILQRCNVTRPYSINVLDGNIYLTTDGNYTSNGDLLCLAPDGTPLWQCEAGMLPSALLDLADGTAYLLNEGNWGSNNASLSRVNLSSGSIDNTVFSSANGRGLGDVAQDAVLYGSKVYVTVSFSNTIEVLSPADNTSVQIKL